MGWGFPSRSRVPVTITMKVTFALPNYLILTGEIFARSLWVRCTAGDVFRSIGDPFRPRNLFNIYFERFNLVLFTFHKEFFEGGEFLSRTLLLQILFIRRRPAGWDGLIVENVRGG